MSRFPIPAIMRERVALSTTSGICRFLTDSEKYPRRRISRETFDMIKCEHTSSPGPGEAACVDSIPGVHAGPQVRGLHSRLEHSIRVLTADGEHVFRLQSQLGCNR